jgi:hypothetical protein
LVGQIWIFWWEGRWLPDTDAVLLVGQMSVQIAPKHIVRELEVEARRIAVDPRVVLAQNG